MKDRKQRRKGGRRLPRGMKVSGMTAVFSQRFRSQRPTPGTVLPTERELRRALGSIPEDLNWEWARPRLAPLFERAGAERVDGEPMLHVVTPLGVAVGFGIEIGPTLARVTKSMAERWEASLEQIEAAAFSHLDRVVSKIGRNALQHAVHQGHMARCLSQPSGWSSSVILAGDEAVTRIFGSHDQVFTAPARHLLLSFDETVPARVMAEMTGALEEVDPHPLLLDPFVLRDGRLSWEGLADDALEERLG